MAPGSDAELMKISKTCGNKAHTEHSRFVGVLSWIWLKYAFCYLGDMPDHVKNALTNEHCCGPDFKAGPGKMTPSKY
jgi:hypothetical protein